MTARNYTDLYAVIGTPTFPSAPTLALAQRAMLPSPMHVLVLVNATLGFIRSAVISATFL